MSRAPNTRADEKLPSEDVAATRQQQHTGNHDKPVSESGSDRHGGTRDGAENVEPAGKTDAR